MSHADRENPRAAVLRTVDCHRVHQLHKLTRGTRDLLPIIRLDVSSKGIAPASASKANSYPPADRKTAQLSWVEDIILWPQPFTEHPKRDPVPIGTYHCKESITAGQGVMVHTCNSRTLEAREEGLVQVQGQPCLHDEFPGSWGYLVKLGLQ